MKIIKKVLMCNPKYFSIKYSINPWMNRRIAINRARAQIQWQRLAETLDSLNINIEEIKPQKENPDMVFTTDAGLLRKKTFVLSNFKHKERQKEKRFFIQRLKKKNYLKIVELSEESFFEGGDGLTYGDKVLLGIGFRTNLKASREIQKHLNCEVINLKLKDPKFYHLDTCLLPIDEKSVAFYPQAFTSSSIQKIKTICPNPVVIKEKEAFNFAANSIISQNSAVVQKNNQNMIDILKQKGKQVFAINVSEFFKSGGGIHCMACSVFEN
ncbi:MAG: hypothetical protein GF347_00250 [Candidatus Moranbacteria bacterium]|nr:hypothetical protein [Candidatus Moranbacteria bacterium]